ncbi:hypothetical protein IE077_001992, partial [Cardiosporidium cionae]
MVPGAAFTCPIGEYPSAGSIGLECKQCLAGFACPNGDAAFPCPLGWYSDIASVKCTMCPPGFHCLEPDASPVACPNGTYSPGGEIACRRVPISLQASANKDMALLPPAGFHYSFIALVLEPCPAGVECLSQGISGYSRERTCSAGEWSAEGDMYCQTCPVGHSCTVPSDMPVPCADASEFSWLGHGKCTAPIPGLSVHIPAFEALPNACPANTQEILGSCAPCTSTDPTVNLLCPEQTPSTDISLYKRLPLEDACPAGSFCPGDTVKGKHFPRQFCPKGHYCPASAVTASNTPIPCPRNTWNPYQNKSTVSDCLACPLSNGFICPLGSSQPIPCPRGQLCNSAGNASPHPTGYYSGLNKGYVNDISQLFVCPPGAYCPAAALTPQPCGEGKYNPNSGSGSVSACLDCPSGHYCPLPATQTPLSCLPGHYCPVSTRFAQACPEGTFVASYGSTNLTECLPCPAGSMCPLGSSTASLYCPAGKYCPEGSSPSSLQPCPEGTFLPRYGGKIEAECLPCPLYGKCPEGSIRPRVILNETFVIPTPSMGKGESCKSFSQNLGTDERCPVTKKCPDGKWNPFLVGIFDDPQPKIERGVCEFKALIWFGIESGIGADISLGIFASKTLCRSTCKTIDNCAFWSWNPSTSHCKLLSERDPLSGDIDSSSSSVYLHSLKNVAEEATRANRTVFVDNLDWIIGPKNCVYKLYKCAFWRNSLQGSSLSTVVADTSSECHSLCISTINCEVAVFNWNSLLCSLYRGIDTTEFIEENSAVVLIAACPIYNSSFKLP